MARDSLLFFERAHSAHDVSAKLKTFTSGGSCANAFTDPAQQQTINPQNSRLAIIQCLITPMLMVHAKKSLSGTGEASHGVPGESRIDASLIPQFASRQARARKRSQTGQGAKRNTEKICRPVASHHFHGRPFVGHRNTRIAQWSFRHPGIPAAACRHGRIGSCKELVTGTDGPTVPAPGS